MGGTETFTKRLLWACEHSVNYLNDDIKRFSMDNDYPGDEDNGAMASYYVFMMCGFVMGDKPSTWAWK